ncbi:slc38a2 [Symbiodinium sp. CCMP2456]|nr:slc38a2 [Symbiodinium sp. CCMP2456]
MKGTMVMCEKTGQVRIPPLAISGYDERKNPYKGRFEDLRSTRIWLKD